MGVHSHAREDERTSPLTSSCHIAGPFHVYSKHTYPRTFFVVATKVGRGESKIEVGDMMRVPVRPLRKPGYFAPPISG